LIGYEDMGMYEIIKKEEENENLILTPKLEKSIEQLFGTLIDVDSRDIIVRDNCKLCNHRLRFEAERKWEELDFNYTQAAGWINEQVDIFNDNAAEENREPYFTVLNVRNHMKSHYQEQERQIRLREYSKKLEALMNVKQDKSKILDLGLAVCYENLAKMASLETAGDLKAEKIRSESINKIMSTMLNIIELQSKMDGDIASTDVLQEKFINVWVDVINKEKSDVKKKILMGMLEEFSHNSGME